MDTANLWLLSDLKVWPRSGPRTLRTQSPNRDRPVFRRRRERGEQTQVSKMTWQSVAPWIHSEIDILNIHWLTWEEWQSLRLKPDINQTSTRHKLQALGPLGSLLVIYLTSACYTFSSLQAWPSKPIQMAWEFLRESIRSWSWTRMVGGMLDESTCHVCCFVEK